MKASRVRWFVVATCMLLAGVVVLGLTLPSVFAAEPGAPGVAAEKAPHPAAGMIALAIGISVAGGALGAGYAVGKAGSAAIGAASERPEMMGRALLFVVIAEGIAVWGLVGAILLIGYMKV